LARVGIDHSVRLQLGTLANCSNCEAKGGYPEKYNFKHCDRKPNESPAILAWFCTTNLHANIVSLAIHLQENDLGHEYEEYLKHREVENRIRIQKQRNANRKNQ